MIWNPGNYEVFVLGVNILVFRRSLTIRKITSESFFSAIEKLWFLSISFLIPDQPSSLICLIYVESHALELSRKSTVGARPGTSDYL